MTAYLGCCCGVPAPTCENQTTGYPCQPVAIVVEGYALQTKVGSNLETETVRCECLSCSSDVVHAPTEYTATLENTGSCFVRVPFKALLIRDGEASYGTPSSGPYLPVASITGGFESNFTYQRVSIGDGFSCPDFGSPSLLCNWTNSLRETKNVSSSNGNEEYELLSFSMSRTVRSFSCEEITPCATEGCYEIFSIEADWRVAGETSGYYSYFRDQGFYNAFTGECSINVESDYGLSCSANGYSSDSLRINQYSEIYPQEPDVCPKVTQRPVSFTIDLGAYTSPPNPSCTVPVACECQDLKGILLHTYGLRGDSLIANEITTGPTMTCIGANWNAPSVAFGNDCSGFHLGKGGSNDFDVSDSASSNNCSPNNSPTCMATVQCGQPIPLAGGCDNSLPDHPQIGSRNRSGFLQGSNGAELMITRHELLYSMPAPSDWPTNV